MDHKTVWVEARRLARAAGVLAKAAEAEKTEEARKAWREAEDKATAACVDAETKSPTTSPEDVAWRSQFDLAQAIREHRVLRTADTRAILGRERGLTAAAISADGVSRGATLSCRTTIKMADAFLAPGQVEMGQPSTPAPPPPEVQTQTFDLMPSVSYAILALHGAMVARAEAKAALARATHLALAASRRSTHAERRAEAEVEAEAYQLAHGRAHARVVALDLWARYLTRAPVEGPAEPAEE